MTEIEPGEHGAKLFSRKMVAGSDQLWEDPEPFDVRSAWVDLCFYARFAPGIVEGEYLQRGEFLASVRFLARRWRWSVGCVHKYLTRLKKLERICERRSVQRGTVYALVNYETYDKLPGDRRTPARTRARTAREQRVNKDNEGGNEGLTKEVGDSTSISNWQAEVASVLSRHCGPCSPGEAGAALTAQIGPDKFSPDETIRAAQHYVQNSTDKEHFKNVRTFAKQLPQWVKKSAPIEIVDERGGISAEFRSALGAA